MNYNLEHLIEEAKAEVVSLMNCNGLEAISDFSVKIKEPSNPNHLACYRGSSVFMSKAIFWINPNVCDIVKREFILETYNDNEEDILKQIKLELWKTLIHEVGHAVADLLRLMARRDSDPDSNERVRQWIGKDEENFAEEFIWYLQTNQVPKLDFYPYYQKMIKELIS